MDISDVWSLLVQLLLPAGAWAVLQLARRIHRRWARSLIEATASGAVVLGTMALLMSLLFEAACTKRVSPIYSPDGRYVVVIRYALQGALGADDAIVKVRPWWRPYASAVSGGRGSWYQPDPSLNDPEILWLDRKRLRIRYYEERNPSCTPRIGEIEVFCEHVR